MSLRRLIVSNWMSLDGFIGGPNREVDWFILPGFIFNSDFAEYLKNLLLSAGGILMGRITYEQFVKTWPERTENTPNVNPIITKRMNNLPKYVFSKSLNNVTWGKWDNAKLMKGNVEEQVRKLKKEKGKDLVVVGSGSVISELAIHGLIDEYQFIMQPIVLGSGIPEFQNMKKRLNLKLKKTTQFKEGPFVNYFEQVV